MHVAPSDTMIVRVGLNSSVETDSALAAWWPANGEVHEMVRGNHDVEFLPRGSAFAAGQVAQGFSFNGSDHYGRTPAHADLDIGASTAGLTIEFWAKTVQVGTRDASLLHWGVPGVSDGVQVRQADNAGRNLAVYLTDTSGVGHSWEVGGIVASDTWVHVAITYIRTTGIARVYKNGVLVYEGNHGVFRPRTNLPLYFGANKDGNDRYLGVFDEICLYTRPLSMSDVQAIHAAGSSGKAPLDDNQPPVVSAGPDIAVLNPAAVVPLSGTVTDDGRPMGHPLTIAWSKVEGPGTVTFTDPSAPSSTATFNAPGTYVLRLSARDIMHVAVTTPAAPGARIVETGPLATEPPC
jgi:hypothetical protein